MQISTKVMLSYSYNNFEHCLTKNITDEATCKDQIIEANKLRIACQMLCDESVRQYKKNKEYSDMDKKYNYLNDCKKFEDELPF